MNKRVRKSGIELLKIVALFLIVISHSVPFYGDHNLNSYVDVNLASASINHFILVFFQNFGQIGNCIFVVCSSWFLLDSKSRGGVRYNKILRIILETWIFSIAFLIIYKTLGANIGFGLIIKQIFPITFQQNWFIGCYLVFYCLHPIMNEYIYSIDKRKHLKSMVVAIIVYSLLQFLIQGAFYYNQLIGFLLIYFITAYMKKYMKKYQANIRLNVIVVFVCAFMYILGLVCLNMLGLKISMLSNKMYLWKQLTNPITIVFALSIFNLFNTVKIKNTFINTVSSLSLIVYIIHENVLFSQYTKPLLWQKIYNNIGYEYVVLLVIGFAIILFVLSIVLAYFYKILLQRWIYALSDKLYEKLNTKVNQIIIKFEKDNSR